LTCAIDTIGQSQREEETWGGAVALFTTTAYPLVALIEDIALGKIGPPDKDRLFGPTSMFGIFSILCTGAIQPAIYFFGRQVPTQA
jgi:hypothetical protein